MFIAISGMSSDLPSDVRDLSKFAKVSSDEIDRGEIHGGSETEEVGIPPITDEMLDRWDVQSHQYVTQAEVKASIVGRIFGSKVTISHKGIVQEAKRFCTRMTATGRRVEFGTAVRLSVAVTSDKFESTLTLPNIAASAQLGHSTARIALSVDGYVGTLGDLLPASESLNVENFAIYMKAFKAIQLRVFGKDGFKFCRPTLLGYEEPPENAT